METASPFPLRQELDRLDGDPDRPRLRLPEEALRLLRFLPWQEDVRVDPQHHLILRSVSFGSGLTGVSLPGH